MHGICMNQYLLPIIKYENIQAKNHDVLALAVHWHVIDASLFWGCSLFRNCSFCNLSIDMTNDYIDPEDSEIVVKAKKTSVEPVDYSYIERDVILYNLGIGATEKDLQWTYE